MPSRIQQEIKQTRPFSSRAQEATIGLMRTADLVRRAVGEVVEPYGITLQQYNVLRILRGTCPAGTSGLPCNAIAGQMLTRDPDMTRLLDRLEKRSLISRAREETDRRVVRTCITEKGLKVLSELDTIVDECNRKHLGHMNQTQLRQLIDLLELARERIEV